MGTCKAKGTEIKERDQRNKRQCGGGSVGRRSVGREVNISAKGGKVDERPHCGSVCRKRSGKRAYKRKEKGEARAQLPF